MRFEISGRLVPVLSKEVFLSLMIFINIYFFNDVIELTLEVKAVCKLDAKRHSFIAYADDITLLANSKTEIQLRIDVRVSESHL